MYIVTTIITTSILLLSSTLESLPTTTKSPAQIELFKRAQACGDLQGNYPNAAAPTCEGSYSICTFTNGYQGCCDGSNNCQFYTSCQGGLVAATSRCSDSSCLQCPSAVPYCSRFEFQQGASVYEGFACGSYYISDDIVYGTVAVATVDASASGSSGSTTTTSSPGSSTASSSRSSSSSASSSASSRSSSAQATGTAAPGSSSAQAEEKKSNKGAIIGGVVGGVIALAIIAGVIWWFTKGRNKDDEAGTPLTLQQPQTRQYGNRYND